MTGRGLDAIRPSWMTSLPPAGGLSPPSPAAPPARRRASPWDQRGPEEGKRAFLENDRERAGGDGGFPGTDGERWREGGFSGTDGGRWREGEHVGRSEGRSSEGRRSREEEERGSSSEARGEVKPYASSRAAGSDRTTLRARRVYVSGTYQILEKELREFFNTFLGEASGKQVTDGCMAVTVNDRGKFSFVEFASMEITQAVLNLKGVVWKGKSLKFEKPKDYELTQQLGTLPHFDVSLARDVEPFVYRTRPPQARIDGDREHQENADRGRHAAYNAGYPPMQQQKQQPPPPPPQQHNNYPPANYGAYAPQQPPMQYTPQAPPPARNGGSSQTNVGLLANLISQSMAGGGGGPPPHVQQQQHQQQQPSYYQPPPPHSDGGYYAQSAPLPPAGYGGSGQAPAPPPPSYGGYPAMPNYPPYGGGMAPAVPAAGYGYAASAPPLPPAPAAAYPSAPSSSSSATIPTTVLVLRNMITPQEARDDKEHREIYDDIESEARNFGRILRLVIPRDGPGVGKVFLQYERLEETMRARDALHGRPFSHRTVEGHFYDLNRFLAGEYQY